MEFFKFFSFFWVLALIFLFFVVYKVAGNKGYNATIWTIVSIFVSPVVCLLALHCLGETNEKRDERIVIDEVLRKQVRDGVYDISAIEKKYQL